MNKKLFSLFVFLLLTSFGLIHKFYVSVTTIKITSESIEIILYTFPDDLEKAIQTNYNRTLDLDKSSKENSFYIEMYLKDHFKLFLDGKPLTYQYLGYTFENEKLLILMEVNQNVKSGKIGVEQTWLTEIYPDQQNIVHVLKGSKKYSEILNKDKTYFEVDF